MHSSTGRQGPRWAWARLTRACVLNLKDGLGNTREDVDCLLGIQNTQEKPTPHYTTIS